MKDLKEYYPKWKLKLWNYIINKHPLWCYTYVDNNIIKHKILGVRID